MKVEVLQGINLEHSVTTIKITLDAKPITSIITLVKSFHPVFLETYDIDNNTISIQSKLPHLWKESAVALNKQATGEWTEDKTKDYILNTVIKNQIKSMSTIPILHACHKLGFETTQFFVSKGILPQPGAYNNRYYTMGIGKNSHVSISIASSGDAYLAQKTQRDKWLTNMVIERLGLPIAKWNIISSPNDIKHLIETYPKPVVIKPTGLVGGNGVTTNINTIQEGKAAYDYAQKTINQKDRATWQQKIMIQQQVNSIAGEDYRILVIGNKMRIATKRIPAFVIGDGKHSIKQLIVELNKDPRRDISNPTHVLKPITIDNAMHRYLKKKDLSINTIPQKDERIRVRLPASMSQGGFTEDVTNKVHPQITAIVESLAASIHGFTVGVDVMCLDISKPLTPENGSIIEINTMPEAYLNSFPTFGKQYPEIGETYVKALLGEKETTKRVVVIGDGNGNKDRNENRDRDANKNGNENRNKNKDKHNTPSQNIDCNSPINEILTEIREKTDIKSDETVGIYRDGAIYINENKLNDNLEPWSAIESLKVNASLDAIVLIYCNLEEVKQYGLGFDKIDILLLKNVKDESVINTVKKYENDGLIQKII